MIDVRPVPTSGFHAEIDDDRAVSWATASASVFRKPSDRWTHAIVGPGSVRAGFASRLSRNPRRARSCAHRQPCLSGSCSSTDRRRRSDPLPAVDRALFDHHFSAAVTLVARSRPARRDLLDVDVADRCRSPVESLAATYIVGSICGSLADGSRSGSDHLASRRAESPGRLELLADTAGLARPGRGRPTSDARPGPRVNPAGDVHPSPALPLAMDQRRRIDPVDRVAALDVEQLERAGRFLAGESVCGAAAMT